jgi:hypothetical protein
MRRRTFTLACVATGLVATLVAATGAHATTGAHAAVGARAAMGARAAGGTVVLVNGHRLTVGPALDGLAPFADGPATPGHGVLVVVRHGGATEDIPAGALAHGGHEPAGRPDAKKYTLTVTGTNPAGKADNGDTAWVISPDNSSPDLGTFRHGSATFSVPAGPYWVMGSFDSTSKTVGAVTHVDVLPQLTVTQNTTVHTAALAATSEVTMVTPRPAAPLDVTFEVNLDGPHDQGTNVLFYDAPGRIWVSPQPARPAAGTVRCLATEQVYGTAAGHGTPYVYNLDYADPPGSIPAQRYVVRTANLATITGVYYQDITSTGAWVIYRQFPDQIGVGFWISGLAPLPGKLTEYYATGPGLLWSSEYNEFGSQVPVGGGEVDDTYRDYHAGQSQVVDWNRYPLHPQPAYSAGGLAGSVGFLYPAALREGNTLWVSPHPFSDSVPGHLATNTAPGNRLTERYTIDQDGVTIASGTTSDNSFPPVTLRRSPSVIRFTLDATRSGPDYKLSARSQTVWTWRSAPDPTATVPRVWICSVKKVHGKPVIERRCAVQPMLTLGYRVGGMLLNGTVPAGRQAIGLSVGHIQLATAAAITGASASASCDGGKTWRKATVGSPGPGRFLVTFGAPGGCDVTLRTSAHDAAGGSITETITNAYAVTG